MRRTIVFLLTLVALIIVGYYLYQECQFQEFTISNNQFLVDKYADVVDKNDTLQSLVEVRKVLERLIEHLEKKYPNEEMITRMKERFDGTILKEANYDAEDPKKSSYTINKGDVMVLCLRTDTGNLVDFNTLCYVAIHELAHIYSSSLHHTPEFWSNMKFLIDEAVEAGLYVDINYAKNPVKYCGLTISTNLPSK